MLYLRAYRREDGEGEFRGSNTSALRRLRPHSPATGSMFRGEGETSAAVHGGEEMSGAGEDAVAGG